MSTDDQTPEPERTVEHPREVPTEALPTTIPMDRHANGEPPTEPLESAPSDAPAAPHAPDSTVPLWTSSDAPADEIPDWRGAQSTEEARAAAAAPPASATSTPDAERTWSAAPASPAPGDRPVWTAASTAPGPNGELPEAPFRSVRVGQLIWAGIVIVVGVFLIGMALIRNIDVPFLLIGLIAVLGFGLIIAAVATSRRRR